MPAVVFTTEHKLCQRSRRPCNECPSVPGSMRRQHWM